MAIMVGWFTLGLLLALIPAYIARSKGRSFGAIYLLSLILFPVGLITALAIHDARRRCPACAEPVQWAANVCPHCRTEIGQAEPAGLAERSATKTEKRILGGLIVAGALAVAGFVLFPIVMDAVTTGPPTMATLIARVEAKSGAASCRYLGMAGGERHFECGSGLSPSVWIVDGDDEIRRID